MTLVHEGGLSPKGHRLPQDSPRSAGITSSPVFLPQLPHVEQLATVSSVVNVEQLAASILTWPNPDSGLSMFGLGEQKQVPGLNSLMFTVGVSVCNRTYGAIRGNMYPVGNTYMLGTWII